MVINNESKSCTDADCFFVYFTATESNTRALFFSPRKTQFLLWKYPTKFMGVNEMLNEREIYLLGKAVVGEIRSNYLLSMGSDTISEHPEKFISYLDTSIASLERMKRFVIDYQKTHEAEEGENPHL